MGLTSRGRFPTSCNSSYLASHCIGLQVDAWIGSEAILTAVSLHVQAAVGGCQIVAEPP